MSWTYTWVVQWTWTCSVKYTFNAHEYERCSIRLLPFPNILFSMIVCVCIKVGQVKTTHNNIFIAREKTILAPICIRFIKNYKKKKRKKLFSSIRFRFAEAPNRKKHETLTQNVTIKTRLFGPLMNAAFNLCLPFIYGLHFVPDCAPSTICEPRSTDTLVQLQMFGIIIMHHRADTAITLIEISHTCSTYSSPASSLLDFIYIIFIHSLSWAVCSPIPKISDLLIRARELYFFTSVSAEIWLFFHRRNLIFSSFLAFEWNTPSKCSGGIVFCAHKTRKICLSHGAVMEAHSGIESNNSAQVTKVISTKAYSFSSCPSSTRNFASGCMQRSAHLRLLHEHRVSIVTLPGCCCFLLAIARIYISPELNAFISFKRHLGTHTTRNPFFLCCEDITTIRCHFISFLYLLIFLGWRYLAFWLFQRLIKFCWLSFYSCFRIYFFTFRFDVHIFPGTIKMMMGPNVCARCERALFSPIARHTFRASYSCAPVADKRLMKNSWEPFIRNSICNIYISEFRMSHDDETLCVCVRTCTPGSV